MEGWGWHLICGEHLGQDETVVRGGGGTDASSLWAPIAVYSENLPRMFASPPPPQVLKKVGSGPGSSAVFLGFGNLGREGILQLSSVVS